MLQFQEQPDGPQVVFVHRSTKSDAEAFFAKRAANARAIADPDGVLFEAFSLSRGSLLQILGPSIWWPGLRALLRGNSIGKPAGNERQMPGAFLVQGRKVLWHHRARHSADHPDLSQIRRHTFLSESGPSESGPSESGTRESGNH